MSTEHFKRGTAQRQLIEQKNFGHWIAIGPGKSSQHVQCQCVCGTIKDVLNSSLRPLRSNSCGCDGKPPPQTGDKFGKWVVVGPTDPNSEGKPRWLCRCECGSEHKFRKCEIASVRAETCGCRKERTVEGPYALKCIWKLMIYRCHNPKHKNYKGYGGRGIKVCDRWRASFENFLADMGPRPTPGHSLDRFPDRDGNYELSNCRWATSVQQMRNTSRNRYLTYKGKTRCVSEWAELIGLTVGALHFRISRGWSVKKALETPLRSPPVPPADTGHPRAHAAPPL